MLKREYYTPGKYSVERIIDKGKVRILYKLPYYPDRIIQWAVLQQIEPIFKEVFETFTCASLPGRGIHYASTMLRKCLAKDPKNT